MSKEKKAVFRIFASLSKSKIREIDKGLQKAQRNVDEHYLSKELEKYKNLRVSVD